MRELWEACTNVESRENRVARRKIKDINSLGPTRPGNSTLTYLLESVEEVVFHTEIIYDDVEGLGFTAPQTAGFHAVSLARVPADRPSRTNSSSMKVRGSVKM